MMKTILLPTDFSQNALKGIEYAFELYGTSGVEYVLVNAVDAPRGKASVFVSVLDKMMESSKVELQKLVNSIKLWDGAEGIRIKPLSIKDGLGTNIQDLIKDLEIDLIVMGTTGGGDMGNKLMGSNTFQVVRTVDIPVYVVPSEAIVKRPKNIGLASDLSDLDNVVVEKIKHFTQRYSARLDIVKVAKTSERIGLEAVEKHKENFDGLEHKYHVVEGENVASDLNKFSAEHNIDLLIMVRKSHTLWERIFDTSATKNMTLTSKIPLLILHQN